MKKLSVPPSVRKKARRTVYKRIGLFLIYFLPVYVFVDFIYTDLKNTDFGNFSTTVFLFLLVPFLLSGFPHKLFDKDWYGEIIKIDAKNNDPAKIDNHSATAVTEKALVKTPDGKLYEWVIFDEGGQFCGERERIYQVGDKVAHVRWTRYLRPLRNADSAKRPIACVICGCKSPSEMKICRTCNSSLEIGTKGTGK